MIFINQLQTKDVRTALSRARNSVQGPAKSPIERWSLKILKYPWFSRLLIFFTITAVLADDIRLAACPKSTDLYFSILAIMTICFFSFELILRLIAIPSVRPSHHGLLSWTSLGLVIDIINILSLFLDISFAGKEQDDVTYFQYSRTSFRAGTFKGTAIRVPLTRTTVCLPMCGCILFSSITQQPMSFDCFGFFEHQGSWPLSCVVHVYVILEEGVEVDRQQVDKKVENKSR